MSGASKVGGNGNPWENYGSTTNQPSRFPAQAPVSSDEVTLQSFSYQHPTQPLPNGKRIIIGCGHKANHSDTVSALRMQSHEGFLTIDKNSNVSPDLCEDITNKNSMKNIEDKSVSLVYFEHIPSFLFSLEKFRIPILDHLQRIVKKNGVVYIETGEFCFLKENMPQVRMDFTEREFKIFDSSKDGYPIEPENKITDFSHDTTFNSSKDGGLNIYAIRM